MLVTFISNTRKDLKMHVEERKERKKKLFFSKPTESQKKITGEHTMHIQFFFILICAMYNTRYHIYIQDTRHKVSAVLRTSARLEMIFYFTLGEFIIIVVDDVESYYWLLTADDDANVHFSTLYCVPLNCY